MRARSVRGRQPGPPQLERLGHSSYGLPFLAPMGPSCDLGTHIPSVNQLTNSYRSTEDTGTNQTQLYPRGAHKPVRDTHTAEQRGSDEGKKHTNCQGSRDRPPPVHPPLSVLSSSV